MEREAADVAAPRDEVAERAASPFPPPAAPLPGRSRVRRVPGPEAQGHGHRRREGLDVVEPALGDEERVAGLQVSLEARDALERRITAGVDVRGAATFPRKIHVAAAPAPRPVVGISTQLMHAEPQLGPSAQSRPCGTRRAGGGEGSNGCYA